MIWYANGIWFKLLSKHVWILIGILLRLLFYLSEFHFAHVKWTDPWNLEMSMDDCRSFPLSLGQNDICKFFSCGDHSNLLEIVIRHIFSMNRLLFMRIIFHKSQMNMTSSLSFFLTCVFVFLFCYLNSILQMSILKYLYYQTIHISCLYGYCLPKTNKV